MCNRLHFDSIRPKNYGFGYKVFNKYNNLLYPPYHYDCVPYFARYDNLICNWVNWNNKIFKKNVDRGLDSDVGFCLTAYLHDAIRIVRELHNIFAYNNFYSEPVLYKIQYADGVAEHIEKNMIPATEIRIVLAKSFRLIKEITPKQQIQFLIDSNQ